MKSIFFTLFIFIQSFAFAQNWEVLKTVPFNGKQDDIFFVSPDIGWYVNGKGFIYKSVDGGKNWTEVLHSPGTYFRALGFVDESLGFAGNIGPDYFPGVTDNNPLYTTADGGKNWSVVKDVTGEDVKGVCAIDVTKTKFINAGQLDVKTTIHAAGRVGGPAAMATSKDLGKTWSTQDLNHVTGMIQDVKFLDENIGFLCSGTNPNIEDSHAQILKTVDGGKSWKTVYESSRPYETTWKCSFPSKKIGYATIQGYNPDSNVSQRFVAKTIDGGDSWTEILLVDDFKVREFGIGFIDESRGWVGTINGGWYTDNGGTTWSHQKMGTAVNKIRVLKDENGFVAFAIGVDVRKITIK